MMFTYLMMSKLIYLLMDWETFNFLSALEQSRGVIGPCKYLRWSFLKKRISNVNLNTLTMILGDFNVGIEEQYMKTFFDNYNLTSLIKQPTCYKNPNNSNNPNNPSNLWLSDFHLMALTIMKKSFRKLNPRLINYRSYKNFSN